MTEFGRLLADDPEIMIPPVMKELSSRRVLTMTYLDGYPLADVIGAGGRCRAAPMGRAQRFMRSCGGRSSSSACCIPIFIREIIW